MSPDEVNDAYFAKVATMVMREQRARAPKAHPANQQEQELRFLATRVAYHLAHGCDTPEKARELALVEWRVGVLGESVNG